MAMAMGTPEPTMIHRGLPEGLAARSSSSRLASRKCDRWFTPALISNPSAVKLGTYTPNRGTDEVTVARLRKPCSTHPLHVVLRDSLRRFAR